MRVGKYAVSPARIEALGWFMAALFFLIYGITVSGGFLNFAFGIVFYVVGKKGVETMLNAC